MTSSKRQSQKDRDAHRSRMEARILKTALKLFAKNGLEDVTIRKVAAAIGYSPGIVYHYFRNKDAIFLRIREDGLAELHSQLHEAVESRTDFSRLTAYARTFLSFAFERPEYYEIMFLTNSPQAAATEHDKESSASDMFKLLTDEVRAAMEKGYLRKSDRPRRISLLLFSSIHGLVSLAKRERLVISGDRSVKEALDESVDLLFEYFRTNSSGKS